MNITLILSGGAGLRVGSSIPKQYIEVGGKPVITYCLKTLHAHESVDAIWVVAEKEWQGKILSWLKMYGLEGSIRGFSLPGENRQLSILNGLEDITKFVGEDDYVMIHDAARPCLSAELIGRCFSAVEGHDGILPVLSMKDTVYLSKDGQTVSSLLDRKEIFAGQAPEVFIFGKYLQANRALADKKIVADDGKENTAILSINGSTEPAILAGMDIAIIPGDERNFKITTKEDLEYFRRLIEG